MNRYPTDEELNALIESLEQQKLYAPKHLKGQILEKVHSEELAEGISEVSESKNQDEQKKNAYQPVSLFTYGFKVAVGMAAALLMLVLLPVQEGRIAGSEQIARREQRQAEDYKEWEENLQKEMYVKEQREAFFAKGRNAAEEKFADVMGSFNNFWKKEAEEN